MAPVTRTLDKHNTWWRRLSFVRRSSRTPTGLGGLEVQLPRHRQLSQPPATTVAPHKKIRWHLLITNCMKDPLSG